MSKNYSTIYISAISLALFIIRDCASVFNGPCNQQRSGVFDGCLMVRHALFVLRLDVQVLFIVLFFQ